MNDEQTARLYVFQYLIGNFDWSFVIADEADTCCHNIQVIITIYIINFCIIITQQ